MTSDLPIPSRAAMLARTDDWTQSAINLQDDRALDRIDRLVKAINDGAAFRWQLGALYIASPSGGCYRVTRAGCDCPNGRYSSARACWHISAFELLLDIFDTEVETNDMEADMLALDPPPPEPCPLGDSEGDTTPRALWARVTTMRGALCAAW